MHQNMMKLNADKTEVMIFISKHNSQFVNNVEITIGDTVVQSTECVRNLGVMFDSRMTMEKQVNSVCKSGYAQ